MFLFLQVRSVTVYFLLLAHNMLVQPECVCKLLKLRSNISQGLTQFEFHIFVKNSTELSDKFLLKYSVKCCNSHHSLTH